MGKEFPPIPFCVLVLLSQPYRLVEGSPRIPMTSPFMSKFISEPTTYILLANQSYLRMSNENEEKLWVQQISAFLFETELPGVLQDSLA